jgi:predicted nucleotidyltransferase
VPEVVTIAERERQELARMRRAYRALSQQLGDYARQNGGRYVVFGSFARDEIRTTSDLDILVDFPERLRPAAMDAAETGCRRHGLRGDVRPVQWCSDDFVDSLRRNGRVLG